MIVEFETEVWRWTVRRESGWCFASVPPELSDGIREIPRMHRGFGAVRVRATLGGSTWTTSIFPGDETYSLPLKKAVRESEGIDVGDTVTVRLEILDA